MRKLFQRLTSDLQAFLDQRDDLILLLACGDNDSALVLKAIRDLEQTDASDIFLLHADSFVQPGPFVTAAINRLAEDHARTNAALQGEQRAPLPPLPDTLGDEAKPPPQRLIQAMDFARSLLPQPEGHRLAWVMFPGQIADQDAYLRLILACSAKDGVRAWMRSVRLIFRVPPDFACKGPPLEGVPRLRLKRADFGPEAMNAALREDAGDPQLPEPERMNARLALAALDYAHGRAAEAIGHYQAVFEFARKTENPAMQALVLNGLGDIPNRQGDLALAQHWYECAIPPAVSSRQPVVLATVVGNLAAIARQRRRFADAASYFESLSTLKDWLFDPAGKAEALEGRGLAQAALGRHESAAACFEEAALLGVGFSLPAAARANLQHLQKICQTQGWTQKQAEVEEALHKIPA